jgi:hypothetical protein
MADSIDPRPKLATTATIEPHPDDPDRKRLLIDGREFPWHIAVEGPSVTAIGPDRLTILHLPLVLPPGTAVVGL